MAAMGEIHSIPKKILKIWRYLSLKRRSTSGQVLCAPAPWRATSSHASLTASIAAVLVREGVSIHKPNHM